MNAQFNYEYVNTNGGQIDGIKQYCTSHYCYTDKSSFEAAKEPCKSHRDGKCFVLEMMRELNG